MSARPVIYGVAGPSGSGKTTYAHAWAKRLGAVPVLELDAYYRPAEPDEVIEERNFDHPSALDMDLFLAHLSAWKSGRGVEVPVYDFATHARTGETAHIDAGPVLVVEGMLLLHFPAVRALLDRSVYLATDFEECYRRRLIRDVKERGRTEANVHEQFRKYVRPMFEKFVEPSRQWADLVID